MRGLSPANGRTWLCRQSVTSDMQTPRGGAEWSRWLRGSVPVESLQNAMVPRAGLRSVDFGANDEKRLNRGRKDRSHLVLRGVEGWRVLVGGDK